MCILRLVEDVGGFLFVLISFLDFVLSFFYILKNLRLLHM